MATEPAVEQVKKHPYSRAPKQRPYHQVVAVPCEIELSSELVEAIQDMMGEDYKHEGSRIGEFIQDRFLERMNQILTDPAEFGKFYLSAFRMSHCLQNAEDIRCTEGEND